MPLVYIILVNYKGYQDTIACVQSLDKISYPNWKVVIVENGSPNESMSKLSSALPGVILLQQEQNLGFAGGNNVGLRYALAHGAEYILFLNNDTLVDPEFLSKMVDAAEADKSLGAIGAKILFATELDKIWWISGKLNLAWGGIQNIGYGQKDIGQYTGILQNDYITGCVFMVPRRVAETVGEWDESYFHTAEDVDLSIRIQNAEFRLVTVTAAKVWHKISQSAGGDVSPTYLYYLERNRLWLMKKYGSWHPVISWFRLAPLLIKRFGAAIIKGLSVASVLGIVSGIKDFAAGKTGKH